MTEKTSSSSENKESEPTSADTTTTAGTSMESNGSPSDSSKEKDGTENAEKYSSKESDEKMNPEKATQNMVKTVLTHLNILHKNSAACDDDSDEESDSAIDCVSPKLSSTFDLCKELNIFLKK